MQIYFNDEESEFVKEQGPGYVRGLVQENMGGLNISKITPRQKIIKEPKQVLRAVSSKGDGKTTCKVCGYKLPFYKAPCKYCKK